MELEMITLNEIRKKKANTIWYHLHVEYKISHKWYLGNKQAHMENRLMVAKREGGGARWSGSLELADANYYI